MRKTIREMSFYLQMPEKSVLLRRASLPAGNEITEVNAHMHTPYSFSAFDSIRQAVQMSVAEGVRVAGINDFNTTDGYGPWAQECLGHNIFPLFNIEFIAMNREDHAAGILVNDPNNPGRTYISGKGLAFPQKLTGRSPELFDRIKSESNAHTEKICARLNEHLAGCGAPFLISFREVADNMTMGNVRERHLARALRMKIAGHFADEVSQATFCQKIFGGRPLESPVDNVAAVENEIRGNLLKAGGMAFVRENPDAFPEVNDICQVIIDAGGIPTYPFLADYADGKFTGFEGDLVNAVTSLKNRGIFAVEFIPSRNTPGVIEKYARYCWENGMTVTFGTEHNTPVMEPVKVYAPGRTELTPLLKEINYKGACIVAANQYLNGTGEKGLSGGFATDAEREDFIRLGHAVISEIIKK
jgi:hypothetical protein